MSDTNESFATAVGCMDGRVQDPIAKYARKRWGIEYVDNITEAGLVKHFVEEFESHPYTKHIKDTIKIKVIDVSVKKHKSKGIVVHGHQECAGNPVSDEKQKQDILKATSVMRGLESGVEVIPLFVVRGKNGWEVEEL